MVSHPCDRKKSQGWGTERLGWSITLSDEKYATPFLHSNKLSSSVAFKAQEDGRSTEKTYIVLLSWPFRLAQNVVFQTLEAVWPTRKFYSQKFRCKT
jgi:hypothetical protein